MEVINVARDYNINFITNSGLNIFLLKVLTTKMSRSAWK